MRLGWRTPRVDSLKLVNCTRIENAHKIRKKTYIFYYVTVICTVQLQYWGDRLNRYGLVWAVTINPPKLPINDKARNDTHIASTGVRLY